MVTLEYDTCQMKIRRNNMRRYMNNWYYVGGVIFVILAFVLALFGDMIDPMRKIMIAFFMSLLIHEFEEYAVPGGFPSAWNIGVSGEIEVGDRYPLNVKSAFIVNVCCAYPIYILGIIFSEIHLLAIFITYFTMMQIIMHGFLMNKKMGTIYNPGFATALFLMLPLGIYNIWYIHTNYEVATWNWWAPLLSFPIVAFFIILLPIKKYQDKKTNYIFPKRDTQGFSIENKSARIRR